MIRQRLSLSFGLNSALPPLLTAAWGARWIFPHDMLADRQSFPGFDTKAGQQLNTWLNKGALSRAFKKTALLAGRHSIDPASDITVTLYEDATGIIRGNPQSSYGYFYVAAWLKADERGELE